MSRKEWGYGRYLREAAVGMLSAWWRIGREVDDLVRGLQALGCVLVLLAAPFLVPLSPLVALLGRASDRRDARQVAELHAERERRLEALRAGKPYIPQPRNYRSL